MMKAIVPGKLLLHNCYRILASWKSWEDEQLVLSHEAKKDLHWWRSALNGWNGAPLSQKEVDIQIRTNASALGWGGCIDNHTLAAGNWQKCVSFQHSNYRELLAVLKTIQSLHQQLAGKNVQVLSDNVTMVAYINRMGGSSEHLSNLMTTLWTTAKAKNITLSARHLAGNLNETADFLSHLRSTYEWVLHPKLFQEINRVWGPCTIDRFASQRTTQLRRYNSLYWNPESEGVDALAQTNWTGELNYCNPPFWMVGKVLRKIQQQQAEAVLIAPMWKGKQWYKTLVKMSVDEPMRLPNNSRTMLKVVAKPEPLKNKKWKLFAWRITGKKG